MLKKTIDIYQKRAIMKTKIRDRYTVEAQKIVRSVRIIFRLKKEAFPMDTVEPGFRSACKANW